MRRPLRVGLLDSGVTDDLLPRVATARRFVAGPDDDVDVLPATSDPVGHGTLLARIVLGHVDAAAADLVIAQAFTRRTEVSMRVVAAALEWLVTEHVRVINLSFGVRRDDPVLRRATRGAVDAGVLLVAATPARGGAVYPAAYPGVVAVCADARCGPEEVSFLGGIPPLFGACPQGSLAAVAGSSCASAHVAGLLAAYLARLPSATGDRATAHLQRTARYIGREQRLA